jgi:N-acetylglutamate synthase/N-acetylornithine aminotransferase
MSRQYRREEKGAPRGLRAGRPPTQAELDFNQRVKAEAEKLVARLKEENVEIHYGGLLAVQNGVASQTPVGLLRRALKGRNICVVFNLNLGSACYKIYTTDLTPGYVKYNMGE